MKIVTREYRDTVEVFDSQTGIAGNVEKKDLCGELYMMCRKAPYVKPYSPEDFPWLCILDGEVPGCITMYSKSPETETRTNALCDIWVFRDGKVVATYPAYDLDGITSDTYIDKAESFEDNGEIVTKLTVTHFCHPAHKQSDEYKAEWLLSGKGTKKGPWEFVKSYKGWKDGEIMVKSEKVFSTQSYCDSFLGFCPITNSARDELRHILDEAGHTELWDYPLSEIEEVLGPDHQVVLVDVSYVGDSDLVQEFRWFEVPEGVSEEKLRKTEQEWPTDTAGRMLVSIPGGRIYVDASVDTDYPGVDIEYVPDKEDNDNPLTRPRVVIERCRQESGEFGPLRALIWADPNSEDYSEKIEFEEEG